MKSFLTLALLLVALCVRSLAQEPSEYQKRIFHLRESLYGPFNDDVDEKTGPPKLDEETKYKLIGELFTIDPYWRLEQELEANIYSLDQQPSAAKAVAKIGGLELVDIRLSIAAAHDQRIPRTQQQAQTEVDQLRTLILRYDSKAVAKLLSSWRN